MFKRVALSVFIISSISLTPAFAAGNGGAGGQGGKGGIDGMDGADGLPGCDGGTKRSKDGKFYIPGTNKECVSSDEDQTNADKAGHSKKD